MKGLPLIRATGYRRRLADLWLAYRACALTKLSYEPLSGVRRASYPDRHEAFARRKPLGCAPGGERYLNRSCIVKVRLS
jgi:hypothetical protein